MTLLANDILAIPEDRPERLFSSGDAAVVKSEYKALARKWHPDHNPDPIAGQVLAHINVLFAKAERLIALGVWHVPGLLKLTGKDGVIRNVRYKRHHRMAIGDLYYGSKYVTFVIANEFADLFENAKARISFFAFKDERMEKHMSPCLPKIAACFETTDQKSVMVVEKAEDQYLLADIVAHFGKKVPADIVPRHVAWIVNRAYEIASYLEIAKLTHNAIGLDTLFVSPKTHAASLLGGWWYALPVGSRMVAAPGKYLRFLPNSLGSFDKAEGKTVYKAGTLFDLELIRAMGREMLGDISGSSFSYSKPAPEPMLSYLRRISSGKALNDYEEWDKQVLPACFGKKVFTLLDLNDDDVFREGA